MPALHFMLGCAVIASNYHWHWVNPYLAMLLALGLSYGLTACFAGD